MPRTKAISLIQLKVSFYCIHFVGADADLRGSGGRGTMRDQSRGPRAHIGGKAFMEKNSFCSDYQATHAQQRGRSDAGDHQRVPPAGD
jgi:hypothetical protein